MEREEIIGTIKWFNGPKGYGFVSIGDGRPDAFLHVSVIQRSGFGMLNEGAVILCDLEPGQKGLQVANILEIKDPGQPDQNPCLSYEAEENIDGIVKFFSSEKGFGFIVPENGGKDVYVGVRTLQDCQLSILEPGQRVSMCVRSSKRGPMAEHISLI